MDEVSFAEDAAFTHRPEEVRLELDCRVSARTLRKAHGSSDAARAVSQRDQRPSVEETVCGGEETGADIHTRNYVSRTDIDILDAKKGWKRPGDRLIDFRRRASWSNRHPDSPSSRWQSALYLT